MRWIVVPLLLSLAPVQALRAESSDRLSYVLLSDHGDNSMVSGSTDDLRLARSYRAGEAPLLYVRQDGVAYVIRDAGFLSRAEAIVAPQRELGDRQGELGHQQGELGRQQGKLGQEQARLGRMMADATPRQMGELGRQQGDLGRKQSALGEQQGELGRRQGELGREQARLAKAATPQFRALVTEAIQRGVAQRVN